LEKLLGADANLPDASKPTNGVNGSNSADGDFEGELDFEGLSLQELATKETPFFRKENAYASQTVEECTCRSLHGRSIFTDVWN
jgi:hypothetical protein